MLEPEAFPTEVEHYFYGTTNASGDCYIWAYIPVENEWYDDPFPPEIMWMRAFYEGSYYLENSEGTYSSSSSTLYPNYYVVAFHDYDDDNINDNEEVIIAQHFKPVLIKSTQVVHPELEENLGNFDSLVKNGFEFNPTWIFENDSSLHYINSSHTTDSHGEWCPIIEIEDTISFSHQGAPNGQRPLYYHVYRGDGNDCFVQYWYWFNLNYIQDQTIHNVWHEGDWEHISIKFSKNEQNYEPIMINLYQHEGGHTKYPYEGKWSSTCESSGDIQVGYDSNHTHPIIYIASNSHASYFYGDEFYYMIIEDIITREVIEHYYDEINYSVDLNGTEGQDFSLFHYDYLEKLGEIDRNSNYYCSLIGKVCDVHSVPRQRTKQWLGFLGRCGGGSRVDSPRVPFWGWDYYNFHVDFSEEGFGNEQTYFYIIGDCQIYWQ